MHDVEVFTSNINTAILMLKIGYVNITHVYENAHSKEEISILTES